MALNVGRKKGAVKLEINQQTIDQIQEILTDDFSQMLVQVTVDASKMDDIIHLLETNPKFSRFPTYHNHAYAKGVAQEIVDLGVIDSLIQHNPDITDIGYNGRFLTVETNSEKYTYGLKKGEQRIDNQYIMKLVQRFALREGADGKNFSKGSPIFNGFSNNIRISATYPSIAPGGITMSLRISRPKLALTNKNWNNFAEKAVYYLLMMFVRAHANILISGETGTGKTELQKLLIGAIPFEDKIIMIEDVAETHLAELYPDKDIYSWITTDGGDVQSSNQKGVTISDHIKNALRNNPKWLMISETRGPEAYEMFQAVLSGHNLITTLHSISNQAVPRRFVGMSSIGYPNINEEMLQEDFLQYMHIGVHIKKKIVNGKVFRYLDELAEFVPKSDEHPNGINVLFEQRLDKNGRYHWHTYEPTKKIKRLVKDELDIDMDEDMSWPVSEGIRDALDPKTGKDMYCEMTGQPLDPKAAPQKF